MNILKLLVILIFNSFLFASDPYSGIAQVFEPVGETEGTRYYLKKLEEERINEELKFFRYGDVKMSIKNECYISGNSIFSHNIFSPSVYDDEYFLILDIKEMIYPNHIKYISFEPMGFEYWNSLKYDYDNRKYFEIIDDSNISIPISLNKLKQIYSIENINFGINGISIFKILGIYDFLKYNKSDLEKEISNCNNKINLEKKEKLINDIISLIIYIICIIIFITIFLKLLNLLKIRYKR